MKFATKIVATSAVVVAVSLSAMSLWQYFRVQAEVQALVEESVIEIMDGVKNTVDEELSVRMELAKLSAGMVSDNPNSSFIGPLIDSATIRSNFQAAGVAFAADGRYQLNLKSWDTTTDWDPRTRVWFKDAMREKRMIVTDPYIDASTQSMLVSLATPIWQGQTPTGVMFFDVNLTQMADTVNSAAMFDAGYLFLVNKAGVVISHPNVELNGKPMDQFLGNWPISEEIEHIAYQGETHLLRFVPLANQDWYLGVLLSEDKVFAPITELRNSSLSITVLSVLATMAMLSLVIAKLLRPLGALNTAMAEAASGEGDLTKRICTQSDQEFAVLADSFNGFVATLQNLITGTKALAAEIHNSTFDASAQVQQSREAMGKQLQEIEMLATAMNEMASTAMEVASHAQGAAAAAQQADTAALRGTQAVEQTAATIQTLATQIESSEQDVLSLREASANIESILSVINGIAEQTNLLALNAAIEAARAGESGRGFAVVADEVRSLAQRTQDSTTEISHMISQLMQGTEAATLSMQESRQLAVLTVDQSVETNHALNEISQAITAISDMNLQIAAAAEQQSLVAEEINANTVNIKDISQVVAGQAQAVDLLVQGQVAMVEQQTDLLNRFTV
uniref:methyl-accepting chemotaxis protein n=1 Tax=Thaumasiovibrio occultus TaxID=1891184 RepID=UPI00131C41AD|nr:methyl-accepting chemotaxis protein [Thaumasiovibrio occultus]